jgi:tripartite-type tricarboxylate transporter receptor subunit TctC
VSVRGARGLAALLAVASAFLHVGVLAAAEERWPTKPIRMVVPFPPGGGTDLVGRKLAVRLSEALGQSVVVDNRGGAGGTIGTDVVAKASPDGYTLGIATSSTHPVASLVMKIAYDPARSFAPVTLIGVTPYVLIAAPGFAPSNLRELIAHLKANPGKANVAHAGTGTLGYLVTEAFEVATGTDIVPVAYKGSAPIYPDLMANRVQLFFDNPVASVPHIKAGKLKAIAVTLPTAQLPDTPTIEQAGLKGFAHGFWYGLVAPAGTPPAIVGRIRKEAAEYLHSATGKADYGAIAVEAIGSTPQQFAATIREDIARWGKLAKALNLQPQ